MKKVKLFFTVIAALLSAAAFAQNVQVSGVVTEESGDVVSGAAVQLKGSTTVYAMTNDLGNYTISVPANGTLVFSCLGYQTAEIQVNGRQVVNVTLAPDTQLLEETIVVAYGQVKREAITGSVSSVKGDALASAPVTSVDKALSGKLAGVQVSGSSGQPGASSNIRIRGYSSIKASNEPLWVVDGIPVLNGNMSELTNTSNAIASLNPNDIESITVLKDAAAAAAYGSRAANGVILVTTKSGKEGKAQFDARAKFGVSWLQSDSGFRVMTAEELLDWSRAATVNAGLNPDEIGVEMVFTTADRRGSLHIQEISQYELVSYQEGKATFATKVLPEKTGMYQVGTRFYAKNPMLPHRQDFPLVKWL